MKIDCKVVGMDSIIERLDFNAPVIKQAHIYALNRTGYDVMDATIEEMRHAFDRPTPYTLSSIRLDKATASKLVAEIGPRLEAGKGTPASKYLGPEIWGGERNEKRSERALQRTGILPQGMYTVPGQGAKLDAYGNITRGTYQQILSWFDSAESKLGRTMNMGDKGRAKAMKGTRTKWGYRYFAVRNPNYHLAMGIWRRTTVTGRSDIEPILMFVKKPVYQKRYRFYEVGLQVAYEMFRRHFYEGMKG